MIFKTRSVLIIGKGGRCGGGLPHQEKVPEEKGGGLLLCVERGAIPGFRARAAGSGWGSLLSHSPET